MAKCATCGKATVFGHNRSFSQRATNRMFKPKRQMHSYHGEKQLGFELLT
ncbi:MAG: hypothetical protein CVU42_16125 [Chloroflexi bacterium HGW-Chloroflexi-4]|nr:MAG: hypothetical protein CVU42_16125 [Chloroflexi bacterium HGW-Chloroflexi-4]